MIVVTIEEAKDRIEELAHRATSGEEIVITQRDSPDLALRPVSAPGPRVERVSGMWKGLVELDDSFFEPMPADWLNDFYTGPVLPSDEDRGARNSDPRQNRS